MKGKLDIVDSWVYHDMLGVMLHLDLITKEDFIQLQYYKLDLIMGG